MPVSEHGGRGALTPWSAIAAFLAAFGVCLLVAIGFTEGTPGKVVNGGCATVFLSLAAVFAIGGRRARRGGDG